MNFRFIIAFSFMTFLSPSLVFASEPYVVAIDGSAWLSKSNTGIRQTLTKGEVLAEGDRIDMFSGNHVFIDLDGTGFNVIKASGSIEMAKLGSGLTTMELFDGSALAMLDNLSLTREFHLNTPISVSVVRGTRLQVDITNRGTEVMTYTGHVKVYGRLEDGQRGMLSTHLFKNQKAIVRGPGKAPEYVGYISDMEKGRADSALTGIQSKVGKVDREDLSDVSTDKLRGKSQAASRNDGQRIGSGKSSDSTQKTSEVVIF